MHQRFGLALFLTLCGAAVTLAPGGRQASDVPPAAAAAEAADPDAVRRATEAVVAGLEHARAERANAAVAAYARAVEALPAFAPWAAVLSAQAEARTGDTAAVRRHLARSDSTLVREWGWRARVDAALARGDEARAARLAEQSAASIRNAARRAEAWTRAGTLHARSGRNTAARAALRRAIDSSTGAGASIEAARTLGSIGRPTAADQLRIGRVYLRHGNFERAADAIAAYVEAGGVTVAERAKLQLELGRGLFNARQYAAAERRLRLATRIAGSSAAARATAAEATYQLGRAQNRRGHSSDARATFLRVTRTFSGTTAAARAHFAIADIDHDEGRLESARTHYRATIDARGPDAALAAVRLASMALLRGQARQAAAVLGRVYRRDGSNADRQQTGFWFAHALTKAGARDSARIVLAQVQKLDPFNYYALRAAEQLGTDPWDFVQSEPAAIGTALRARVGRSVDVIAVLRGAGLPESSEFEVARVFDRFADVPGAFYALGAAFHDHEMTYHGIRVGRELLRREGGWNRAVLELVYPFPYRAALTAAARANELDPYLIAGLIRQESMFNPRARSVAGALGLMQVMPATGARVARSLGMRSFRASQLRDPAINLRLGTRYFADQLRSHNGRLIDAIAAYNAGPTRVARWREFPEHRDPDLFAERIPFDETRDYVRIVRQNTRIYRALYGGAQAR